MDKNYFMKLQALQFKSGMKGKGGEQWKSVCALGGKTSQNKSLSKILADQLT